MKQEKYLARAKAHITYKQLDGTIVPGITTVNKYLTDANILCRWGNKMGLQGIDTGKYVDILADVGTLVHFLIECDLLKKEPYLDDYAPNQVEKAQKIFRTKYLPWKNQHDLVHVAMERPLVSELYPFGGTGDFYGYFDNVFSYIDFKTSKACYLNHKVQAVACAKLWEERVGDEVKDIRILRFGRSDQEGFEEIHVNMWDDMWGAFKNCLGLYAFEKKMGAK